MSIRSRILSFVSMMALALAGAGRARAQEPILQKLKGPVPAIGSWFGIAVESCAPEDSTCPQASLYMTPTVFADGNFIGNDDFSFGGPPFGPHSTAHGQWIQTSNTGITVDYVFMTPGATATTINAPRFRWLANVTSWNTMVGYVNVFFGPPIPLAWSALTADEFPPIPAEQLIPLTPPTTFYDDPAKCPGGPAAGCPLVFKFTVQRVTPQ